MPPDPLAQIRLLIHGSRACETCGTALEIQDDPDYWHDRCEAHSVHNDTARSGCPTCNQALRVLLKILDPAPQPQPKPKRDLTLSVDVLRDPPIEIATLRLTPATLEKLRHGGIVEIPLVALFGYDPPFSGASIRVQACSEQTPGADVVTVGADVVTDVSDV